MYDKFTHDLECFAEKCSAYFSSGGLDEYFKTLCADKDIESYYNVFSSHCAGGKRIRAYLVKTGFELFGKNAGDEIIPPALSYEIFQTGVLCHDDIIDESPVRRFRPSMYVELGANHTGVSRAICQGDLGIIAACGIIARADFDEKIRLKAIDHQCRVFFSTVAGELKDVDLSEKPAHILDEILSMYELKTARYTVSGPLVLGAILAGQDESVCKKLDEIGKNIGIAFQIRDDILGIYAHESVIGKSVTSDMREGKKTVLSAHFLQKASDKEKQIFEGIYGNALSGDRELETVKELFKSSGSLSFAQELCKSYVQKARELLEALQIPSERREIVEQLLSYMTMREK